MWTTQEVDVKDLLNLADLAYDINQVTICFPLYPLTVFINRGLFCFLPEVRHLEKDSLMKARLEAQPQLDEDLWGYLSDSDDLPIPSYLIRFL